MRKITFIHFISLVLIFNSCDFKGSGFKNTPELQRTMDSGDVFGFEKEFELELEKIGELSIEGFMKKYVVPDSDYVEKLSYDPTAGRYFSEIQTSKLKMDINEMAMLSKSGFVVSGRLGYVSFGRIYLDIFKSDLPVFITADSVLHAWHRSYDELLKQFEVKYFMAELKIILKEMAGQTRALHELAGNEYKPAVKQVDEFISVARRLLQSGGETPDIGNQNTVDELMRAVFNGKISSVKIFGKDRKMDFSMFKPRGHYTESAALSNYFRAMMWLGRADMRIYADNSIKVQDTEKDILGALILSELLEKSKMYDRWKSLNDFMTTLFGGADSATFTDILEIMKSQSYEGIGKCTPKIVHAIRTKFIESGVGKQAISSAIVETTQYSPRVKLPHSFTFLGQRFTMDSWAIGKVVFDKISRNKKKLLRTRPSALDVAFSVFGNNDAAGLTAHRIKNGYEVQRDGIEYQHNLAAARNVIDKRPAGQWSESVYASWLNTLRSLSNPRKIEKNPEVFRTKQWGMRVMNTQIASWTQLRHDTVLYVKPASGNSLGCFYPEGYVEPVPEFWKALGKMVLTMADHLERITYPETTRYRNNYKPGVQMKKRQLEFLRNFARTVELLRRVSEKQLRGEQLIEEEKYLVKNVVQRERHGSGTITYDGWYPALFYKGTTDCVKPDLIVSDVYSIPTGKGVIDGVLHEAIGGVDTMYISIKNGEDIVTYIGPCLSHYEMFSRGTSRLNDAEWRKKVDKKDIPQRPEWTKNYLIQ